MSGCCLKKSSAILTPTCCSRRVVEHIIEALIDCKHNPFDGGYFNGNDCMRLLENCSLLFEMLRNAATDESDVDAKMKLDDVANRLEKIFTHFAQVVPTYFSINQLS